MHVLFFLKAEESGLILSVSVRVSHIKAIIPTFPASKTFLSTFRADFPQTTSKTKEYMFLPDIGASTGL